MHVGETPAFDRARVASDPTYNLATGTQILAAKWKATKCVGDNQPSIVEDWYTAVWAYNGLAYSNNPNNPNLDPNRGVYNPAAGGSYTYQERVFGRVEHPPSPDPRKAVALAYPDRAECGAKGSPPDLAEPHCASPTDCVGQRGVHVSSCFAQNQGGAAGAGGQAGAGGSAGMQAGAGGSAGTQGGAGAGAGAQGGAAPAGAGGSSSNQGGAEQGGSAGEQSAGAAGDAAGGAPAGGSGASGGVAGNQPTGGPGGTSAGGASAGGASAGGDAPGPGGASGTPGAAGAGGAAGELAGGSAGRPGGGVVVRDSAPDSEQAGGCSCRATPGTPVPSGTTALLFLLALLPRRRAPRARGGRG
jgi:MYXO-CTERM domain-containing protein